MSRPGLFFVLALLGARTASAQLDNATIEQVEQVLLDKMEADRIPGLSIALVVDGALVWTGALGTADLENGVPATANTAYRTASTGKPMTATAAMQLVESGRIDLDAPITRYCPAFPAKRWTITTRHLLSHTSGIRHYGGPNNDAEVFNTVRYESVVDALAIFSGDSLRFEPGTASLYSTFGYNTLGCVVEGASGLDFVTYMRDRVFGPAGMHATQVDDPLEIITNRARGYQIVEGTLLNSRAVDMTSKIPAGGFITTAPDLARFAIAVMDHRLVSSETFEDMITPQVLPDGTELGNGLGWGLFPGEDWYGEREAFHGGITPQVSGMLYLLPDRRFAVALLTNLEGVPGRTALAADIARIVLRLDQDQQR